MLQESLALVQYDVTRLGGDPAPILRNVCGAVSALFIYLIDEESVEHDLPRLYSLCRVPTPKHSNAVYHPSSGINEEL
jgi:hypothetical protein